MAAIRVGDVGTELVVAITDQAGAIVDVSGATVKTIYLEKPDKTVLTKAAVLDTTGTDGLIKYLTIAGDLDQKGTWTIQGYVELPGGNWHTGEASFRVKSNLA